MEAASEWVLASPVGDSWRVCILGHTRPSVSGMCDLPCGRRASLTFLHPFASDSANDIVLIVSETPQFGKSTNVPDSKYSTVIIAAHTVCHLITKCSS